MGAIVKVAHVMRRFVPGKWGGTESVVFNSALELQQRGIASPIFCTDMFAQPGEERVEGVSVRRFPYVFPWLFLGDDARAKLQLKGGSPLSFGLLRALWREPELSLIHTHVQHRLGGIARTVARHRGIPYVASIHGGWFTMPAEQQERMQDPFRGKPEWGKLFGWLLGARRTLEDAAAIICVGRDEQAAVRQRFPHRAERVHYLPNGVRVALFRDASPEPFRQRFNFQPTDRLVLCVSRLDYQKNQLLLLRAFAEFAKLHPCHRLVLIGAATVEAYHQEIQAEVARLELDGRVTIIPGLPPDDPLLPSAYRAAEILSCPPPMNRSASSFWRRGRRGCRSSPPGLAGFPVSPPTTLTSACLKTATSNGSRLSWRCWPTIPSGANASPPPPAGRWRRSTTGAASATVSWKFTKMRPPASPPVLDGWWAGLGFVRLV